MKYSGGERTPDLIAVPYFIGVVDRKVLGDEAWQLYLDYLDDIFSGEPEFIDGELFEPEESPLILIDQESRPLKGKHVKFYHCSPKNSNEIVNIIENKHKKEIK